MSDTSTATPSDTATPMESTATPPPASAPTSAPGTALEIAARLNAGTITAEQAGRLSKAANIDTMAVAKAAATLREMNDPKPDPDAVKLDEEFGPVAAPHEYVINYFPPGAPGVMTAEMKQFDANARQSLVEAGFSLSAGTSLITTITRVLKETQHLTEGELDSYRHTELSKLQAAHGDKLTERLAAADDMLDELERQRPGWKAVVMSRAGTNALLWNQLIHHVPVFHARRKAQGR